MSKHSKTRRQNRRSNNSSWTSGGYSHTQSAHTGYAKRSARSGRYSYRNNQTWPRPNDDMANTRTDTLLAGQDSCHPASHENLGLRSSPSCASQHRLENDRHYCGPRPDIEHEKESGTSRMKFLRAANASSPKQMLGSKFQDALERGHPSKSRVSALSQTNRRNSCADLRMEIKPVAETPYSNAKARVRPPPRRRSSTWSGNTAAAAPWSHKNTSSQSSSMGHLPRWYASAMSPKYQADNFGCDSHINYSRRTQDTTVSVDHGHAFSNKRSTEESVPIPYQSAQTYSRKIQKFHSGALGKPKRTAESSQIERMNWNQTPASAPSCADKNSLLKCPTAAPVSAASRSPDMFSEHFQENELCNEDQIDGYRATAPKENCEGRVMFDGGTFPDSSACNVFTSNANENHCAQKTHINSSEGLSGKMTTDDWKQLRHDALVCGSETEKLAFKLLQETVLSPINGLSVSTLECISNVLDKVPQTQIQGQTMVDWISLPAELRATIPSLSSIRPFKTNPLEEVQVVSSEERRESSKTQSYDTNAAQVSSDTTDEKETAQSCAMSTLADNFIYLFEGGAEVFTSSTNDLRAKRQLPMRGRIADRHTFPKSLREKGLFPKFDDCIELDPLFRSLLAAQYERSLHVQRQDATSYK